MCHQTHWQMLEQPAEHQRRRGYGGGGSRGRTSIKRRESSAAHPERTQISHQSSAVSGNKSSLLGTPGLLLALFSHSKHIISQHRRYITIWDSRYCHLCATTATKGCVCASLLTGGTLASKRHIISVAPASIVPKLLFFCMFVTTG